MPTGSYSSGGEQAAHALEALLPPSLLSGLSGDETVISPCSLSASTNCIPCIPEKSVFRIRTLAVAVRRAM